MANKDSENLAGGAFLVGTGILFLLGTLRQDIGTPQSMGPGYFPMIVSILVVALGVAIFVPALFRRGVHPKIEWRPLFVISASVGTFALTIDHLGLIPAIVVTVGVAALAERRPRPVQTLALAFAIALAAWLVFLVGLRLPVPAFRMPL